jgi:hypothetical protein
MSFAFYAAPVDNENVGEINQPIHRKKITKTMKKYPSEQSYVEDNIQTKIDYNKVNQVMKAMSNLPAQQDDELGDFNPPPPPQSSGVQATIYREVAPLDDKEGLTNQTQPSPNKSYLFSQLPTPTPTTNHNPYYIPSASVGLSDNELLMEKINYMIHLLEEQQDEKSGSVTEEVILYSFLGIFIIFIVDSFYHVGKYTR